MKVALCTLILNEMEWVAKLYAQHADWPGLVRWIFVEAADRMYAGANPDMVTSHGLSVDGTTDYLSNLARMDDRIIHVRHGFSEAKDPAQGKCAARSRYLREIEADAPDFFVVLDADEFYANNAQGHLNALMNGVDLQRHEAVVLRHREIWRPPSVMSDPLFSREVVGGFWSIPYCRVWRWSPGLTYAQNHNTPETPTGRPLDRTLFRGDSPGLRYPGMIHLGFASAARNRVAKNRYYEHRGEGRTDHRGWYVESRAAWQDWQEGDRLPRGAMVIPYTGPVPEVFA